MLTGPACVNRDETLVVATKGEAQSEPRKCETSMAVQELRKMDSPTARGKMIDRGEGKVAAL